MCDLLLQNDHCLGLGRYLGEVTHRFLTLPNSIRNIFVPLNVFKPITNLDPEVVFPLEVLAVLCNCAKLTASSSRHIELHFHCNA